MALIVLPRMSPANVNTLPRQLAGWQTHTVPPPPDRQRVKGQLSDAHCRPLSAANSANTSYLMRTWQANYEWELGAAGGVGSPASTALARLNFPPDRILMW